MDLKMSSSLGLGITKNIKTFTFFISFNWDIKFHVHTNAPLLVVGARLAQNLT
jgi:hypothetical protein